MTADDQVVRPLGDVGRERGAEARGRVGRRDQVPSRVAQLDTSIEVVDVGGHADGQVDLAGAGLEAEIVQVRGLFNEAGAADLRAVRAQGRRRGYAVAVVVRAI